ncbi:MAG TPA: hypothetical protein VM261_34155 [Kofleriaceae bacterium]|nr:hypothetical protein [Kofleriaceae bacterium]
MTRVAALALLLSASTAFADEPVEPVPLDATARDEELEELRREIQRDRERLDALAPLSRYVNAYVDVGFFATGGDGSGVRSDTGHRVFPEYDGMIPAEWVLMGDPLSTAVNARGEPADLGASRAITDDTIDSEGRPGFIVNSLGLVIDRDVTDEITLRARAELLPRSSGDLFDVAIARIEYRPLRAPWLWLTAGRTDSVVGLEYRDQDPTGRLSVTPSLICRYICGYPLGMQARMRSGDSTLAVAITAGDMFVDQFEPDHSIVSDTIPTVAGRAARVLDDLGTGLEIGFSGAIGPQHGPPDAADLQWHLGVDAHVDDFHDVELQVEYVQCRAPGAGMNGIVPCADVACLRYKGAYLLAGWRARNWLEPYVRVDWRDALHQQGVDFVYVSELARATVGVRLELTHRAIAKIEYTHNQELGAIPEFPNDVLTTALVVSTN